MAATKFALSQQRYLTLRSYSIYRLLLAIALITLLWADLTQQLVGDYESDIFKYSVYALGIVGLIGLSVIFRPPFDPNSQEIVGWLLTDTCLTFAFIYATGGLGSSLLPLYLVIVVVGAVLLQGQLVFLIASVATISLLVAAVSIANSTSEAQSLFTAAAWGFGLFLMAGSVSLLAKRLYATMESEEAQSSLIIELQAINNRIIGRMNTGVIVIDHLLNVKQINPAAKRLLACENEDIRNLSALKEAADCFHQWQENPHHYAREIAVDDTHVVKLSFVELVEQQESLIFIEDQARLRYRVEQMKLASLGHLTASIAHEIRNPLSAISYARELLSQAPELTDDSRHFLDIIQRQEHRVNRIVSNTFELSKHDSVNSERIDLKPFLEAVLQELQEMHEFQSGDIIFAANEPAFTVEFDRDHLRQITMNLFENAKRYGKLPISVEYRILAGALSLDICDQGEALDDSTQKQIFEPFFTLSDKGTGLGLYISRQLCQANRANLMYSNYRGHSRFSIVMSSWSKTADD
ncbi:sensor histidine kinase [Umboniibacter marinipuniceus]|uniref:histidine kinase n=1 Tax=Umboniibacter marinipuniceus TaxID=569599 RepID=A0A3M0A4D1_9GAMM|nr:histidine kinase dimerization/phospho-acceptor domain-containing protein [Umboniibacter marinipuniceus]RMA78389.1 two-component system sensor histidine kinase PilS (NtrC family) [Umboniibacter marinipuniceus]